MSDMNVGLHREPWNKGKLVGQKAPLKPKDIWAIRTRLQMQGRVRELAMSDLGIDSKLRGCDLVRLRVRDICHGDSVAPRAIVMQQKTHRPVQFEITAATRDAVGAWIRAARLKADAFVFPSRLHASPHLGTRQYARILRGWLGEIGLDPTAYGTHSIRRTKASLIYRRTKNLSAVQLLLGHTKLESTVRFLGIDVDDALEIAEQTEIDPWHDRFRGRTPRTAPGAKPALCGQKQPIAAGCQVHSKRSCQGPRASPLHGIGPSLKAKAMR